MTAPRLTLIQVAGAFAVCRLDATAPIPAWATAGDLFCVARTADELSIVCSAALAPPGVRMEAGWRCLAVAGPFDFATTGVISSIAGPLAAAGIPLFVFSTFDTDYVLLKDADLQAAARSLSQAGHSVRLY